MVIYLRSIPCAAGEANPHLAAGALAGDVAGLAALVAGAPAATAAATTTVATLAAAAEAAATLAAAPAAATLAAAGTVATVAAALRRGRQRGISIEAHCKPQTQRARSQAHSIGMLATCRVMR